MASLSSGWRSARPCSPRPMPRTPSASPLVTHDRRHVPSKSGSTHQRPERRRRRRSYNKLGNSLVESRTRAVAYRTGGACCERRLSWPLSPRSPSLRLAPPLIEPDVTISVIRLSDGFHGRHSQGRAAAGWLLLGRHVQRPLKRL